MRPMFKSRPEKNKKQNKKQARSPKVVDVKVKIPLTTVSITSFFLIGLLTLIGYSGYLGVNSIWKFTHPKFSVSLDALKSLEYIARGSSIPTFPRPTFNNPGDPDVTEQRNYIKALSDYKIEFRAKYPDSKLLRITDNELYNIGYAFCSAKNDSIAKSGGYSSEDIIEAFQAKFVLRYRNIKELGEYLDAVGQRAFQHLCGGP